MTAFVGNQLDNSSPSYTAGSNFPATALVGNSFDGGPPQTIYFHMRGYSASTTSYKTWIVGGTPDTNANLYTGAGTPLTQIVVERKVTVTSATSVSEPN